MTDHDWRWHKDEAERLLGSIAEAIKGIEDERDVPLPLLEAWNRNAMREIARAQVHATLATIRDDELPATAEDLRGAEAEIERLRDILAGHATLTDPEMVEKVARLLNERVYVRQGEVVADWDHLREDYRREYLAVARAVLAAIGGDHA